MNRGAASLQRVHRLTRPSDFQAVFKNGRRFSDSQFVILVRPNGLEHARLGLAISRRYLPTAVARNRVKRIVRESFRRHRSELPPVDLVVLAQRDTRAAPGAQLSASLARHWKKIAPCNAH